MNNLSVLHFVSVPLKATPTDEMDNFPETREPMSVSFNGQLPQVGDSIRINGRSYRVRQVTWNIQADNTAETEIYAIPIG